MNQWIEQAKAAIVQGQDHIDFVSHCHVDNRKIAGRAYRNAETALAKDALTNAGFQNVRVSHGTGTASAWLEIKVAGQFTSDEYDRAINIAALATGRTGGAKDHIGVTFYAPILAARN